MENLIIRKMRIEDYEDLSKNVFTEMSIEEVKKNVEFNVSDMEKNTNYYFVAELNNEVVGTIYLKYDNTSINKHMGELNSILVSNNHQGKGIFKSMFNYIIEFSKELGIEILLVSVRKRCISETVYQKVGFIKYGELPNGIKNEDGSYTDKVLYYYEI